MYCEKCGNEIKEDSNFCNKCGNLLKANLKAVDNEKNIDSILFDKTYNFRKVKQIGKLNMLVIKTNVSIKEKLLSIEKNKYYLGFIKGKSEEKNINLCELNNVISKKSLDLIDGIYAIIFALLTIILMNPAMLIVTAVCLWTGYGEKIFIYTKKNERVIIHTQGGEKTKELVDLLKLN